MLVVVVLLVFLSMFLHFCFVLDDSGHLKTRAAKEYRMGLHDAIAEASMVGINGGCALPTVDPAEDYRLGTISPDASPVQYHMI